MNHAASGIRMYQSICEVYNQINNNADDHQFYRLRLFFSADDYRAVCSSDLHFAYSASFQLSSIELGFCTLYFPIAMAVSILSSCRIQIVLRSSMARVANTDNKDLESVPFFQLLSSQQPSALEED